MAFLVRENEPTRHQNQLLMGETEATRHSSLMHVFLKQIHLRVLELFAGDEQNGSSFVYSTNTNDLEVSHRDATSPSVRLRLPFYFVST